MLKAAPANVGDPRLVVPGQSPLDTPPSTHESSQVNLVKSIRPTWFEDETAAMKKWQSVASLRPKHGTANVHMSASRPR